MLTFAQDEVKGNENKIRRHGPVGDEARNTEGTGQQPCIYLEGFVCTLDTGSSSMVWHAMATYIVADQFIHQRVRPFVACPEFQKIPGNESGG